MSYVLLLNARHILIVYKLFINAIYMISVLLFTLVQLVSFVFFFSFFVCLFLSPLCMCMCIFAISQSIRATLCACGTFTGTMLFIYCILHFFILILLLRLNNLSCGVSKVSLKIIYPPICLSSPGISRLFLLCHQNSKYPHYSPM